MAKWLRQFSRQEIQMAKNTWKKNVFSQQRTTSWMFTEIPSSFKSEWLSSKIRAANANKDSEGGTVMHARG